ncbi:serine/threonine-protein kinase, partial [Streptomyces niveiscabiei]|uniref:serine/threonine-protein kinase n=1 Tax=Streptomyces niveiscabiei TaxID=164115 RepID=UPI001F0B15AF
MQGLLLAGRYRLVDSIGSGGMGRVWRAHDELLHRAVAIKELTAALYVAEADQAVLLARTRAEARAAARINHSAVVTVHDVLEHDGRPWIVMELVEGRSLADAVKADGRVEPAEAARIGMWVLRALRAAHSAGVLHRDVKPGNVLLSEDGRVLLTDFGIAQIEGDTTITRTGEVVGSVDYLAPERVRGNDPGPSSDLWALGALLFRSVQGHAPYPEESTAELVQMVCGEPPAFAEECGPLRPVVESLLRQDPTERPDFEELRGWLRSLVRSAPEAEAGAYVVTAPPADPRRLPIIRRKGELVRRRKARAKAAAGGAHARHKRGRVEPERAPRGAERSPRSLGRTLLVIVLLLLAGAIAYAVLFMPKAGEEGAANSPGRRP